MTSDQTILFALFVAVFGLLIWGRLRYDIVAFSALMAAVVLQVAPRRKRSPASATPRRWWWRWC